VYDIEVIGYASGEYDLVISVPDGMDMHQYSLLGVNSDASTDDQVRFDSSSGTLALETEGEAKSYSFECSMTSNGTTTSLLVEDVTQDTGSNYLYTVEDWDTLDDGSSVKLDCDQDGDGTYDAEIDLQDGMTGADIEDQLDQGSGGDDALFLIIGIVSVVIIGIVIAVLFVRRKTGPDE